MSSALYISKTIKVFCLAETSMSSAFAFPRLLMPFVFKRLQCLHLHFKRLQCLQSFYTFKDFNIFYLLRFTRLQPLLSFIGLNIFVFVFHRTQRPLFLCFEKKNFRCLPLYRTLMSSCFLGFTSLVFASCPIK